MVTPDGYIKTARHVAATWRAVYNNFPFTPSKIYDVDRQTLKIQQKGKLLTDEQLREKLQYANKWIPARTKLLVEKRKVVLDNPLEGRVDKFDVTFPRDKLRIPARLVRMSDQHDVALIKVDLPRQTPDLNAYTTTTVRGAPALWLSFWGIQRFLLT